MQTTSRKVLALLAGGALIFGLVGAGSVAIPAGAATSRTCSGTQAAPGLLAGTYASGVTVSGVCEVNGGPTVVEGTLTLTPGSFLHATFALNDRGGAGASSLTVNGNVVVRSGATALLGCLPSSSPCEDDPNAQTSPTLSMSPRITGSLVSTNALGVVAHNLVVGGSVTQTGGGGGATCAPVGPFTLDDSPAFTTYEDSVIGGSVVETGIQSCWLGTIRNRIGGSVVVRNNTMADPDAMEITSNMIQASLVCSGNSPAVQYGDGGGTPNLVHGGAAGECAFGVTAPNPVDPSPISVKA